MLKRSLDQPCSLSLPASLPSFTYCYHMFSLGWAYLHTCLTRTGCCSVNSMLRGVSWLQRQFLWWWVSWECLKTDKHIPPLQTEQLLGLNPEALRVLRLILYANSNCVYISNALRPLCEEFSILIWFDTVWASQLQVATGLNWLGASLLSVRLWIQTDNATGLFTSPAWLA